MGIFDAIKSAMSLEEEDEDSLYEAEMKELERKERSKSTSSKRNRRTEDEEPDDDVDEDERPVSKRAFSDRRFSGNRASSSVQERRNQTNTRKNYDSSRISPPRSPESTYSQRKNQSSYQRRSQADDNIVRMRSRDTSEISILKLQTLADAQEVCDSLMEGRPIIVSFEDPRGPEAQRIMDFISGCLYVMNGNLHTISDSIFLFSPKGVDVSGDYLNLMQNNGFGIPTFNKMM